MSQDELLLCFDHLGNQIDPQTRSVVHTKPYHIWHGVTAIWVFNNKKEILCTKRSEKNEGNPGKWQTYVGGHVKSNQTFLDAAIAELGEELGLTVSADRLFIIDQKKREDVMHVVSQYGLLFDKPLSSLSFADGEISSASWISFEEYNRQKQEQPDAWCNSMSTDDYQKAMEIIAKRGIGID